MQQSGGRCDPPAWGLGRRERDLPRIASLCPHRITQGSFKKSGFLSVLRIAKGGPDPLSFPEPGQRSPQDSRLRNLPGISPGQALPRASCRSEDPERETRRVHPLQSASAMYSSVYFPVPSCCEAVRAAPRDSKSAVPSELASPRRNHNPAGPPYHDVRLRRPLRAALAAHPLAVAPRGPRRLAAARVARGRPQGRARRAAAVAAARRGPAGHLRRARARRRRGIGGRCARQRGDAGAAPGGAGQRASGGCSQGRRGWPAARSRTQPGSIGCTGAAAKAGTRSGTAGVPLPPRLHKRNPVLPPRPRLLPRPTTPRTTRPPTPTGAARPPAAGRRRPRPARRGRLAPLPPPPAGLPRLPPLAERLVRADRLPARRRGRGVCLAHRAAAAARHPEGGAGEGTRCTAGAGRRDGAARRGAGGGAAEGEGVARRGGERGVHLRGQLGAGRRGRVIRSEGWPSMWKEGDSVGFDAWTFDTEHNACDTSTPPARCTRPAKAAPAPSRFRTPPAASAPRTRCPPSSPRSRTCRTPPCTVPRRRTSRPGG